MIDNTKMTPNQSDNNLDVEEEYTKTLRTKSFLDMWDKVHHQLRRSFSLSFMPYSSDDDLSSCDIDIEAQTTIASTSSSRSRIQNLQSCRLPSFIIEPSQESIVHHRELHALLIDYFDVTYEACIACTKLLACMSRARAHHRSIHHILLRLNSISHHPRNKNCTELKALSTIIDSENPLQQQNLAHFYYVQSRYALLIEQLTTLHRKLLKKLRIIRLFKKAAGVVAIGACSIAAVVALVLTLHTVVGAAVLMAAAPVVTITAVPRARNGMTKRGKLQKLNSQVDAAARGAYIMGREFDTMTRMVRRLHDEVEHGRDVAKMVVARSGDEDRRRMLEDVMREVAGGAAAVSEQLEELDQHVNLCFITINRCRRMVAQEIFGGGVAPARPASAGNLVID